MRWSIYAKVNDLDGCKYLLNSVFSQLGTNLAWLDQTPPLCSPAMGGIQSGYTRLAGYRVGGA